MDIDNFVEKNQYTGETNISWGNPTSNSYESYFKNIHASTKRLKAASVADLLPEKTTFEEAMQEFKRNGSDSPYNPDEDRRWSFNDYTGNLIGMGPSSGFLRQRSWPEPERSSWVPSPHAKEFVPAAPATPIQPPPVTPVLEKTAAIGTSMPVTNSLDNLEEALYLVLRELKLRCWDKTDKRRFNKQCRFCKNNGERELYYSSHSLKDELGRVSCPVLRAFVCRRCGAKGDYAHTIKYCPFSTDEERLKSTAMMRSVRLASGRRRYNLPAPSPLDDCDYSSFHSEGLPSTVSVAPPPLDASWAALERKLMR